MKQVIFSLIVLTVLAGGRIAHAQENTLYIHPLSLVYSASNGAPWIFLTFEHPMNEGSALLLMPEMLFGAGGHILGLGVATRKYLNGGQEGVYLQARAKYANLSSEDSFNNTMDANLLSFLGYVGTKGQWDSICMFTDIGVGYGLLSGEVNIDGLSGSGSGSGFWFDINLGLGYAF